MRTKAQIRNRHLHSPRSHCVQAHLTATGRVFLRLELLRTDMSNSMLCVYCAVSFHFLVWWGVMFWNSVLAFGHCLSAHNNLSHHTFAHACLQSIKFIGGADIFLFLNCITSTIRGTARQQIGCKNFWNADVSAPTQHNAPSEWRHLICVYGYSRPTCRHMRLKHSKRSLQT